MSPSPTEALLRDVRSRLTSWPSPKLVVNGLSLLVGGLSSTHDARMIQARRVLAGMAALEALPSRGSMPLVLMKGLEVAQLYPSPEQRPFRDLDLLAHDARPLWDSLVAQGYRPTDQPLGTRFHHLPALDHPRGLIGVDVHERPNTPGWGLIDASFVFATAEPSRTGVPGLLRPRDDVHALLVALHGWIGGMRRSRDLLDALLLATVSPVPVEETAAGLGLARFWRWTVRFAEAELQGRTDRATDAAHRVVFAGSSSPLAEPWTRVVAPYLTATPWRVTRGHLYDYSIVSEARRAPFAVRRSTPGD